jgi:hypothetical protein
MDDRQWSKGENQIISLEGGLNALKLSMGLINHLHNKCIFSLAK